MPDKPSYAWHTEGVRWVEPFDVKGKLHLFDVPDERIRHVGPITSEEEMRGVLRELYLPHVHIARSDDEVREFWEDATGE